MKVEFWLKSEYQLSYWFVFYVWVNEHKTKINSLHTETIKVSPGHL